MKHQVEKENLSKIQIFHNRIWKIRLITQIDHQTLYAKEKKISGANERNIF